MATESTLPVADESIRPGARLPSPVDIMAGIVEVDSIPSIVERSVEAAEATQAILRGVVDGALIPSSAVEALARSLRARDTSIDADEVVARFEERGYVKDAPRFEEQLVDETRTETFLYTRANSRAGTMTEHEGLVQLNDLFVGVAEALAEMPEAQRMHTRETLVHLVETQVASMRDSLTFIGRREYDEGVGGLGERWRAFLEDNPDTQLCVVADVGKLDRYKVRSQRKSDDKLREDVLLTFSPEELAKYGDRIVGSLDDINRPIHNVRIVLLDDWTISGEQMRDSYRRLFESDPGLISAAMEAGSLEINLLTAGEERLRNGFFIDVFRPDEGAVPVFAYYRSHSAPRAKLRTGGHVTGLHSSVNWDFAKTIGGLVNFAHSLRLGMPRSIALANVVRKYNMQNGVLELTPDGVMVATNQTQDTYAHEGVFV